MERHKRKEQNYKNGNGSENSRKNQQMDFGFMRICAGHGDGDHRMGDCGTGNDDLHCGW